MSNFSLLRSSYSLNDVVSSYYASGCLPKCLPFKSLIHSLPQRYTPDFELLHPHLAANTNLLLVQRIPDLFNISSSITTRRLIVNADMRHTFSNLSNVSTRDDELLSLATFYTEHVGCIIAITDENVPDPLIPTCPAVAAGRSGIKESITTTIPLSHSRTLRKKKPSSDLRADFLRNELPDARLVPLRRIPTVETLVQTRGSHRGPPSGVQVEAVSQFKKLTRATANIFQSHHRVGLH